MCIFQCLIYVLYLYKKYIFSKFHQLINLTPSLEIIDPGSDLVIFLSSQVELRRFLWPLVWRRWALGCCSLLRMCCCCCCLVIRELCTNVASAQAVLEVSKYTQQATQSAKLDAAPSYPRPSSMWKPESLKIADTSRLPSDQRVIAIICFSERLGTLFHDPPYSDHRQQLQTEGTNVDTGVVINRLFISAGEKPVSRAFVKII